MTDIKPVGKVMKSDEGHLRVAWSVIPDVDMTVYSESAITQAREEGRREGMREAADEMAPAIRLLSGSLDEVEAEVDAGWSPAAKSGLRKIRVAYSAITRASEGK